MIIGYSPCKYVLSLEEVRMALAYVMGSPENLSINFPVSLQFCVNTNK